MSQAAKNFEIHAAVIITPATFNVSKSLKNEIFLWLNGNNINQIVFMPEYLPKDVAMSSLRLLTKTFQESGIMFLIAADICLQKRFYP